MNNTIRAEYMLQNQRILKENELRRCKRSASIEVLPYYNMNYTIRVEYMLQNQRILKENELRRKRFDQEKVEVVVV